MLGTEKNSLFQFAPRITSCILKITFSHRISSPQRITSRGALPNSSPSFYFEQIRLDTTGRSVFLTFRNKTGFLLSFPWMHIKPASIWVVMTGLLPAKITCVQAVLTPDFNQLCPGHFGYGVRNNSCDCKLCKLIIFFRRLHTMIRSVCYTCLPLWYIDYSLLLFQVCQSVTEFYCILYPFIMSSNNRS